MSFARSPEDRFIADAAKSAALPLIHREREAVIRGIVHDSHLKHFDQGYGALWWAEDEQYAFDLIKQRRPEIYEDRIFKIWNDHPIRDDPRFAPIAVTFKEDLVVSAGLTRIAQLMTGVSSTSFTHFESGTGTNAESAGDTALQTALTRVSMASSGDRYATGTSAKFAGFFGSSTSSGTVAEGGAFDNGSGGTMLFRSVYASTLAHTSGSTTYTLQQTITQSAS